MNKNQVLEGALSNLISALTGGTDRAGDAKPAFRVLLSDVLRDLLTVPSRTPVKD